LLECSIEPRVPTRGSFAYRHRYCVHMATFERVQRPFWMHQIVEYVLGIALIMTAVQQPEPAIPAMMGLLVLLNTAVAIGPAGAFRLVPRRLHKQLDLVVIALLFFMAVQPFWSIDSTGRLIMAAIGVVMLFIWFHSDFTAPADRKAEKAARRAAGAPVTSETVGKSAGRVVGEGVNSFKRWKDSMGGSE
jgi:uncharacterized membrane protein YhaH (DUF805 family)